MNAGEITKNYLSVLGASMDTNINCDPSGELRHVQNYRNSFPPLPLFIEYLFCAQKKRLDL